MSLAVAALAQRISEAHGSLRSLGEQRPLIVAIDGRSGTGKSTLAAAVAEQLNARPLTAQVIDGDDFYAGGVTVRPEPPEVLAGLCIDWRRQREVLQTLRAGERAQWHPFDWDAFDGSLSPELHSCEPCDAVLLEGVYSARAELADLLDLRVLLTVPDEVRLSRLLAREGELGPWERQWHAAEACYLDETSARAFDLVIKDA